MANRPITIHVLTNASAEGRAGSFLGPPPFLKHDVGDVVNFNVIPPSSTFRIVFVGLSPFPVNVITETSSAADRTLQFAGHYHYQVSVTTSTGDTYRITNCPEMEI